MYLSFYIDDEFFSGDAEPLDLPLETQYKVDLGENLKFTIFMSDEAAWDSDDPVSKDIVNAVGQELQKRDDSFTEGAMQPGHYYSQALTGGQKPIYEEWEIINEPEDVDEQSPEIKA